MYARKDLLETQVSSEPDQILLEAQADSLALCLGPDGKREDLEVFASGVHRDGDQSVSLKPTERYRINTFTEPTQQEIYDIYLNCALNILRPSILLMASKHFK